VHSFDAFERAARRPVEEESCMNVGGRAALLGWIMVAAAPVAAAPPDPAAGQKLFVRCAACHSVMPNKQGIGPSLAGLVGRKAGSVPGYSYSPAMRASKLVWSRAMLDRYLAGPAKMVPGNKMPFAGIASDPDRANLVAYLATLK